LVDGSGGAGQWRGGMGLRRVYRAEAACRVRVDGARFRSAPWGLAGGEPGGKADVALRDGAEPFRGGHGGLRAGEIIDITIAGAGGYGSPAERDHGLVRRDLAEGRIDARTAREAYRLTSED
jgi:N-methylhydantoinase B